MSVNKLEKRDTKLIKSNYFPQIISSLQRLNKVADSFDCDGSKHYQFSLI